MRYCQCFYLFILSVIGTVIPRNACGQNFATYFCDSTLRIDYIFSGNAVHQQIAVDQLHSLPHWYGKRQRLSQVPMEGNGQFIVRDHQSKTVIYRNSFSTLFQEWLTYDEAKSSMKSFENVFLIPLPKDTVDITIRLNNNRRNPFVELTHTVAPSDILIRHIGEKHITPYQTIQKAKDTTRCIHIAYLAEGYKSDEMDVFLHDAQKATDAIFSHEPYRSMKDKFNIIAVKAPSEESGTSIPSRGIWKNTALQSHFDTFYSARYLTTLRLKTVHDWLAGTPYEHIIILVNTPEYGGGGILNSYNLAMTHHPSFKPVVVHEFGHSFAGLADEYAYDFESIDMYPTDVEPWEPNITTKVNFDEKWKDLIGTNSAIGLFEGAGYAVKGVYRPALHCRMRDNETPDFCPVCQRAIQRVIDFYTQ